MSRPGTESRGVRTRVLPKPTAFLDPDRLAALVPPEHGRYRRAVVEGLALFLLRLGLTAETGLRWFVHPRSRSFGSHLSNEDPMTLMLTWPLAAWHLWRRG